MQYIRSSYWYETEEFKRISRRDEFYEIEFKRRKDKTDDNSYPQIIFKYSEINKK